MKFTLLALTVLATSVLGKFAGGAAQAKKIDKESTHLPAGKYRFVNAASKKGLKYTRNGQSLYAAKGKGDWLSIKTHHAHVVISPSGSNNKCLSAAWSYKQGANGYAALYKCKVAKFKRDGLWNDNLETRQFKYNTLGFTQEKRDVVPTEGTRLEKRVALRDAKQYFYIHRGAQKHTYHIIAYDHLSDMPKRAVSDCNTKPEWDKKGKTVMACLVKETDDKHQTWFIYNSKGKLM